jgi:hypothetical protein
MIIKEGSDPTVRGTGDDRVAHVERAALHQDGSYRTAPFVQVRLDSHALSIHLGIGPQVQGRVSGQDDRLQQRVQTLASDRGHIDEHGLAAVLLRHQAVLGELTTDLRRIGTHLVDLVDCHDHRYFGCQGVIQCLDGLWHDAVVGRDHQHGDIGRLGTTGTHRRKRLVTWSVDKGDLAFLVLHFGGNLVRADGLGDATRLTGHHVRLPDRVEQLRLAMIDMAHHRDDRRPGFEILLAAGVLAELDVEALQQLAVLVLRRDDLDVVVELGAQRLQRVVTHRLGRGHHLSEMEQHLNQ